MKWKKNIILCCLILIIACKKTITPIPVQVNKEFFATSENYVKNGDVINFTLTTPGEYTLTMIDTIQNQVISRERFIGRLGMNSLKIYTNTLPTKLLSVELKNQSNQQVGKTKIIIN